MVAALQIQSTRQQILEYLQRHGRATVKELSSLLGLTSTGIRQHLTVLERDGLVDAREERGRVGRPTLVYSLTEKADALFPKTYDALASVLLEEIRASQGNERLHELLRQVAERMAGPYTERMEGKPLAERVRELIKHPIYWLSLHWFDEDCHGRSLRIRSESDLFAGQGDEDG